MNIKFTKIFKSGLIILEKYLAYFFIYGLLGWLIDSMHDSFASGQIIFGGMFKSFLLPIPFAPIYGFGALLVISMRKFLWHKNSVLLAFFVGLILTAVEYLGGVVTVTVLGHRAWDYSNRFANLHGHIDLYHGILWMILGWGFVKYIHPAVEKFVNKLLAKIHSAEKRAVIDKKIAIR